MLGCWGAGVPSNVRRGATQVLPGGSSSHSVLLFLEGP